MSSQSGQKALRIGLIQNDKFIEERLMRTARPVTIGSALHKNTFIVPASDLPATQTVFDVNAGRYLLQFTSKMSGRVSLGDRVYSFDELIQQGKATKSGNGYSLPLPAAARGKVVIGEVTLLFQFVTPPPPRPRPVLPASMRGGWTTTERTLTVFLVISALLHIAPIIWILNHEWIEPNDMEYVFPDRIVQIMVDKPEEELPELEPLPVEDGEGEGESVAEAEEPSPQPSSGGGEDEGTPEDRAEARARERTMREVEGKTLLRVLGAKGDGGGSVVDTLLDGVGNISAEEAFASSTGVAHAQAGGERSGLRGRGSQDADGVGARAGIDDVGSLKGASKAKAGVDTGKTRETEIKARPLRIQDPSDVIGGTLDNKAISTAIRRRQAAIQSCYERELRRNNSAGGRIVVNFTVTARGSRGAVSQARAVVDDVGGGVGQCVANEIKNLRGLPAPDGGDVIINMPFVFQPGQ